MQKSFRALAPALMACLAACEQRPVAPLEPEVASTPGFSAAETQGAAVAELRAATARYHRVEAALADGYTRDTPCIYNTPGGRGVTYRNIALIDGVADPTRPELLLYEPQQNGELRLVSVAFIVPSALWDPFHASPPMFGDQPFIDRRLPPTGAPIPNYFLVVWAWQHNPLGMYALYNPQVSCEYDDTAVVR